MNKNHVLAQVLLPLLASLCIACFAEESMTYHSGEMSYSIYGGSLGNPVDAKSNNQKIAFELKGKAARDIFGAIGPDRVDACTSEYKMRVRWRDNQRFLCLRRGSEDYSCYFGFDLKNGKSIGGSIC